MTATPRKLIGSYSARQQSTVLRQLTRERGAGWAKDLTRADYTAVVLAALAARYDEAGR